MPDREVWFAIPSASPERCRKTLPVWRSKGYRIAVLQNYERGDIPADSVVWSDHYPGWARSINILCRDHVPRTADIVVSGGDDMLPDPNRSAQELAAEFFERFPDGFGVMQPHGDTFMEARRYCGSPFLGRGWIDTAYGGSGPMWPDYQHNWADNELYWLAKGLSALWERHDLSHFHDHFTRNGEEKPSYWKEGVEKRDLDDCKLYIERSWGRFPGHEPRGVDRRFDSSVLAQGAMHLAEVRMAVVSYTEAGEAVRNDAVATALRRCKQEGLDPVAIYGGGQHTRSVWNALMEAPVRIACIIDDESGGRGRSLWGWPVVTRDEALKMDVRAIVLSSTLHEGCMWDNCAAFHARGVPVIRLYSPMLDEKIQRVSRAIEHCADKGYARIAFYGAGKHTHDVAGYLGESPLNPVCVIDDEARPGDMIGKLPVVSMSRAIGMDLQAVILSSDRQEAALWRNARALHETGVEVVPLYTSPPQWPVLSAAVAGN